MMKAFVRVGVIAAFLVGGVAARADAPDAATGKRIAGAIKCDAAAKDPLRAWCAATLQGTTAVALPAATETYFGITLELRPDGDVRKALLENVSASALHVGPGGAKIMTIKPDNAGEQKEIAEAIMSAAAALKGLTLVVEVPAGLYGFLKSEQKKPLHPVTRKPTHGEFTGKIPARIYRTATAWVVIEDAAQGKFVNVYPAVPLRGK